MNRKRSKYISLIRHETRGIKPRLSLPVLITSIDGQFRTVNSILLPRLTNFGKKIKHLAPSVVASSVATFLQPHPRQAIVAIGR